MNVPLLHDNHLHWPPENVFDQNPFESFKIRSKNSGQQLVCENGTSKSNVQRFGFTVEIKNISSSAVSITRSTVCVRRVF